jgi:hypothetical protein
MRNDFAFILNLRTPETWMFRCPPKLFQGNVMKLFKYALFASFLFLGLSGCMPEGSYTGGGWLVSAEEDGDGKANFGFNATNCDGVVEGHFNYRDKGAKVAMNGDIVEFHKCVFGDCLLVDFCDYYSVVEYKSTAKKNKGFGEALLCASDDGEGANSLGLNDFGVYVLSGPHDGYLNFGKVSGNIQSHECEEEFEEF